MDLLVDVSVLCLLKGPVTKTEEKKEKEKKS